MSSPTISAVVPAYNAEEYIRESLTAILSQTHAPEEVVVVDDGSTDGTQDVLALFRDEVRVVRQANRGVAGAMNRCFEEARGDYVAKCDADDIWEPQKLERQFAALLAHPRVDIAIGGARCFGLAEGPRLPYPGAGVLEPRELARSLYRANFVCASSMLIRRELYQQLGPFVDDLACEDYDYWLRALAAGAVFFYDPSSLVRYRSHEQQVSGNVLRMHEAELKVHGWHAALIDDAALVRKVRARDLARIARLQVDQGHPRQAREAFASSLRQRPTLGALAWVALLSAPDRYRRPLADRAVAIKRALDPALAARITLRKPAA
jgi:glycosyltransferase involved in cell wall biosynthesis